MEDDKVDTVFPLPFYAALIAFILCWPAAVFAAPVFALKAEGIRIVLHDEACTLSAVSNLPYRATWEEKGQVFEGCWSPRPDMGVVVGYFADKTAVAMPIQRFEKLIGV